MSLFNELKRRNVLRVGAAYVVVAWLILQIGDTLAPALRLPEWVISVLAFFLILGFPLAVFFAWAYEMTPEGLRLDKEVRRGKSLAPGSGRKLDFAIIGLLAVALGFFIWESRFQNGNDVPTEAVDKAEQTAVEPDQADIKPSIAVLPFDNRSNREEDQFFTDGMHDDLLTTIAKVGSMKVISRTSVMEYRDTIKKIPQIAKELGVAHILEGGIQRSGNQVRINVQLIDAATDEHLWAEIYDRELTAENLFSIQSEISKAIADALHAALSPEEVQRIDTMPTRNLEALEAYLRGRQLMATRDAEKLRLAVEQFNKAVELDPNFALAWVGVADSNDLLASYGRLKREDYFPIRQAAIEHALATDNELGEAYASLGSLYYAKGQNEKAEAAYKRAIHLSPNYATAWQWYANSVQTDPLRADETLELLRKAAELDPRSSIIGMNLAGELSSRGLYSMAERQYLNVIELDPEFSLAIRTLAYFYLDALGRFDQAIVYFRKIVELAPGRPAALYSLVSIYLNLDDLAAAESIYESMHDLDADSRAVRQAGLEINLYKNNAIEIRDAIDTMLAESGDDPRRATTIGFYELAAGNKFRARELFLSENPGWLDPDKEQSSNNLRNFGCIVSWILINTGDAELGRQLLQKSTTAIDESLRAFGGHKDVQKPEICYLAAGDTETALQSLETQLAHNHLYDWFLYHRLPMYDLIRDKPRYKAVLQERERRVAIQRAAIATMDTAAGT